MAEEKYIAQEYTSSRQQDKTKPDVVIYSTTGERHSVEAFDRAMAQFDKPGEQQWTTPAGFTALPKGSVPEWFRDKYEQGNALVQGANQWIQNTLPGQPVEDWQKPETRPSLNPINMVGSTVKVLSHLLSENVNTPEKAAISAGLTALGVGPHGKALRQTSGPLPAAIRAGTAGVASGVASLATGTGASESPQTPLLHRAAIQPLLIAASVAGAEGGYGALRSAMGRSLPAKANEQVRQDIVTAMAKAHPELKLSGDTGLEQYLRTPGGLESAIRAGVKAVKSEAQILNRTFIDDINSVMPGKMPKETEKLVKTLIDKHDEVATKLFDNLGNEKLEVSLSTELTTIKNAITSTIGDAYKRPHLPPSPHAGARARVPVMEEKRLAALMTVWNKYADAQERFAAFGEVLKAFKVSGQGAGWDTNRFQNHVRSKLLSAEGLPDSPLMNDVLGASVRGGQIGSADRRLNIGLGAIPDWIMRSGADVPLDMLRLGATPSPGRSIPMGTLYRGTVRDTPTIIPLDIAIANGISSFLNRTPEKKP